VFDQEHLEKMKEGILLFNEQKYWECHEVFEDLWREDLHDPIRYIYWAVIQVAAACIHYRDNNLIGAQGMIAKAKEKFRHCRDAHILSPLASQKLNWDEFEAIVMRIPDSSGSKLEDFAEIYEFRFPV
jgi:uncharacterized protein